MKIQYIITTCMLVCATNCIGTEVMKPEERNTSFSHKKVLPTHTSKKLSQQNQPHTHHKPLSLQDELEKKAVSTAKADKVEDSDIRKALETRRETIKNFPSLRYKGFTILEGGFLDFDNNL